MSLIARQTEALSASSLLSDKARLRTMICQRSRTILSEKFADSIEAIVLTGSMARDEATCVLEEGTVHVLGDAEFLLLFQQSLQQPGAAALELIARKIEANLLGENIRCSVDLGPVPQDYFQKLPPHIFSYELKTCGKQIFGQRDVLSEVPDFSPSQISKEDAWRLVCNRLMELLDCREDLFSPTPVLKERLQYKTVKLYLDMATSLLIFSGRYAPTYRERSKNLQLLATDRAPEMPAELDLAGFAQHVSACTAIKLQDGAASFAELSPHEALTTAQKLWRWELQQLIGADVGGSGDENFWRFCSSQTFSQRLRGWAYAARSLGFGASLAESWRWLRLIRKASPRFLVYFVGTHLLFGRAGGSGSTQPTQTDVNDLARLLPSLKFPAGNVNEAGWEKLAHLAFQNYQQFVLKTRA